MEYLKPHGINDAQRFRVVEDVQRKKKYIDQTEG